MTSRKAEVRNQNSGVGFCKLCTCSPLTPGTCTFARHLSLVTDLIMALTHFPALVIFSFLVSVVFAVLAKEAPRERLVYGVKVFAAFVGTALVLGWLIYFFPR